LNENLEYLYCSNNNLNSLPPLNENLRILFCSSNKLTLLPQLNENLQKLYCSNNQLTSLPLLNENLQKLFCYNNKLTLLPQLNENLEYLYCEYNKLTSLPPLNINLQVLYCHNNKLPKILNDDNANITENKRKLINNIAKCRYRIMCLKYRELFRRWLWVKVRQPKIQEHYHPDKLKEILDKLGEDCDENELDEAIDRW
jgi:Leucine-rich repeat (LRR) protein